MAFVDQAQAMFDTISVLPVEDGWIVQGPSIKQALRFLSGARAEQMARSLATALARSGQDAEVAIHDRNHVLIGKTRYGPPKKSWSHTFMGHCQSK